MRFDLSENRRFSYRVGGLAIHKGKVLLHRAEFDDFWVLPGGSCEFNEESHQALSRELNEELNATVKVTSLLWVVENFFAYDGKFVHELGLYYSFDFVSTSEKFYESKKFEGTEIHPKTKKPFKLYFEWFSFDELANLSIKPNFLKTRLLQLPESVERVVQRE